MKKNFLVLLISLVVISCSSSSDNDDKKTTAPALPTSEALQVTLPNSAPAQAQAFAGLSNVGSAFIGAYGNLPNGSVSNGVYTWSLTYEGMTLSVTASEASNGDFSWEFRLNGTDSETQTVYDNWLFMSGSVNAAGTAGSWTMYDIESQSSVAAMTAEWSTNSTGTLTTTVTMSGASNDGPDISYTVVQNADGSGSLTVKHNGTSIYTCTWNADGTGTWADLLEQTNGTF